MREVSLLLALAPLVVWAQEPAFMEAGTHPGAAQLYQRVLVTYSPEAEDRTKEGQVVLKTAYGIRAWTAILPDVSLNADGDWTGSLRLKQRILQRDTGPIDTWRASFQGGAEWVESRSPGARAGLVSTTIRGRHGVNFQFDWRGGAERMERFALHASHLYRIRPQRYSPATRGAWYTMAETLNYFDNKGSHTPELALGLLYEARRWAAELSWKTGDPTRAPQREEQTLAVGFRYLW